LKSAFRGSATSVFHQGTRLHEWFKSTGLLTPVRFKRLFQLEHS
jgi:hypothetical protein